MYYSLSGDLVVEVHDKKFVQVWCEYPIHDRLERCWAVGKALDPGFFQK